MDEIRERNRYLIDKMFNFHIENCGKPQSVVIGTINSLAGYHPTVEKLINWVSTSLPTMLEQG